MCRNRKDTNHERRLRHGSFGDVQKRDDSTVEFRGRIGQLYHHIRVRGCSGRLSSVESSCPRVWDAFRQLHLVALLCEEHANGIRTALANGAKSHQHPLSVVPLALLPLLT
jgi:hypothetical protein